LADLVQIVRHAIEPASAPLETYGEQVRRNYERWKVEKVKAGVSFTAEQEEWLDRMAEHIGTSLRLEQTDFETGWFGQQGSLGRAYSLFGDALAPLIVELNEKVAA